MVYKQSKSKYWWFKFTWNGQVVRKSTKQANKRVAEQIESAHRTALAKGEVGIRKRKPSPTLKEFAEKDFIPFVVSHFAEKLTTVAYYKNRIGHLTADSDLASCPLDEITPEKVTRFVTRHRDDGYEVSSTNRCLQVLRRMLRLAVEWGRTEKAPPKISLLPGEKRRERVLTFVEEDKYLKAASAIGDQILADYNRALDGIRARQRDQQPIKPEDPYLVRDVATVLLDCGLRPEECYRLRWEYVRDGCLHIPFGKTESARRTIPLPPRSSAILEMRRSGLAGVWVFPAATKSGHIEQSTIRKRHARVCQRVKLAHFPVYTFRHTCLTRWAAHMDPYTLAYLAGHSDFGTTRRYVHPQSDTVLAAMEKVRGGHTSRHTDQLPLLDATPGTRATDYLYKS